MPLTDSASCSSPVESIPAPTTAHDPGREGGGVGEVAPIRPKAILGGLADAKGAAPERRQKRLDRIQGLGRAKDVIEAREGDYSVYREKILMIHALLNEDGVIAPAFRPLIARQKFRGEPVGDRIFHDQMRIDLHWLIHRGCVGGSSPARDALSVMSRHGIDAPGAKAFLMLPRKMKARVADLKVSRWRQWECIWHCTKKLRTTRNGLLDARDKNLRRLEEAKLTTPVGSIKASLSRVDLRKICDVALAWEIGRLRDPKVTAAEHARLYHVVSGDDEVTRHSIRHQREQVRRYIPSCGATPAVRGGPTP